MNRIYLIFFSFLLLLLFQIPIIKKYSIESAIYLQNLLNNFIHYVENKIQFINNQQLLINNLEQENLKLKKQIVTLNSQVVVCKDLKEFKLLNDINFTFVKAISYASIPDFTQIYINYSKKFSSIKGLIFNNLAAGVVVKNLGNYSLAYLLNNPKVSFSVIVGNKEIPGIFKGGSFKIEYLKKFENIQIGDVVKTSGLDGIFHKGVLVGKVIKINQKKLYQEAIIKPFYNKLTPTYFYVVEKK